MKKVRRGRPKKDTIAVDTSGSEDDAAKTEKKRGRPKKEVVSVNTGDAMINSLVEQASSSKEQEQASSSKEHEQASSSKEHEAVAIEELGEEAEVEVEVVKFQHKGKAYLKSSDNIIYDVSSWEELGRWNVEKSEIVLCSNLEE